MASVSIYFFAGDFADVLKRYDEGRQQIYQTHNEVARLVYDLLSANYHVTFYSFITPEPRDERPREGFRVVSLGAKDFSATSLLSSAVTEDVSEVIVAHFPNLELLRSVIMADRRASAFLATSYNRAGLRSRFQQRKIVSLLNNQKFELVSNHCMPATEHLARMGVKRGKLIAWDVPHPFDPASLKPKTLIPRDRYEAVYVGSIAEGKGVFDIVRALALLREQKVEVHCSLAGLGDIQGMNALAVKLGVSDLLSFVGLIGNNEVFAKMVAADLVLVPSQTEYPEGFPLTMFEAIASRTPIVCSDHPMFRPVIADGRNASVFPAGDHRALATAIKRTLTQPDLYAALSANAPQTWEGLKGPADWRTTIVKWVTEGKESPWLRDHMLIAAEKRLRNGSPSLAIS